MDQCNPRLSELISQTLKLPKAAFLKDLPKLEGLLKHVDEPAFIKKWAAVKQSNKERLAHYVEVTTGHKINTQAMFDVQIKVRSPFYSAAFSSGADCSFICSVCMSTRYDRDPEFFLDWHFEIRLFVLRSVKL